MPRALAHLALLDRKTSREHSLWRVELTNGRRRVRKRTPQGKRSIIWASLTRNSKRPMPATKENHSLLRRNKHMRADFMMHRDRKPSASIAKTLDVNKQNRWKCCIDTAKADRCRLEVPNIYLRGCTSVKTPPYQDVSTVEYPATSARKLRLVSK